MDSSTSSHSGYLHQSDDDDDESKLNDDSTITDKSGDGFCLYLIGFDTDLDGVVDDTLDGDEDLHCPVLQQEKKEVQELKASTSTFN